MKKVKDFGAQKKGKDAYLLATVLIVVAVGVGYIIVGQVYNTGSFVKSSDCVDSDSGLNYDTMGYVTFRGQKYADYCSGNTLIERYCSSADSSASSRATSKKYKCSTSCYNGACGVAPCEQGCTVVGAKECVDTTVGPAYRTCGNYDADSCLEWSSHTYCPKGYSCSGGFCVALGRSL